MIRHALRGRKVLKATDNGSKELAANGKQQVADSLSSLSLRIRTSPRNLRLSRVHSRNGRLLHTHNKYFPFDKLKRLSGTHASRILSFMNHQVDFLPLPAQQF